MKATLFGTLPPIKGNAYYCWHLSKALSDRVNIEFIAFRRLYPDFLYPGGTTDDSPAFKVSSSQNLKIRRILSCYNPLSWVYAGLTARGKIAHLQWWSIPIGIIWMVILPILKIRGKKIFLTLHNILPHEKSFLDKFVSKWAFSFCDRFFVHSPKNRKQLIEIFKTPEDKIIDVPMGVHDAYKMDKKTSKTEARRFLGLSPQLKIILLFGNLREYKGIGEAIEAINVLRDKLDNVCLLIAGQKWIKWDKYQELIDGYNLQEVIKTHFKYLPMHEVRYYFIAADLVILPYQHFEAQSGIGNIALAFGKPMVVTKVGALLDLVKDKMAVAEPYNYTDLSEKIYRVLTDEGLYGKLCRDSKELASHFSWEKAADITIRAYDELL